MMKSTVSFVGTIIFAMLVSFAISFSESLILRPTAVVKPPTDPKAGQVWVHPVDGAQMVFVPAGEFVMGTPGKTYDESPQRKVYVDAFWIDRYEVTNELYCKFLNAVKRTKDEQGHHYLNLKLGKQHQRAHIEKVDGLWRPQKGFEKFPVICVSWFGAAAYAKWAGKRLPTEAEWEKAARGTDGRKFPWGNNWNDKACNWWEEGKIDGYLTASPVGIFPLGKSPYSCFDMLGNLEEWCADWYQKDYYRRAPKRNPKGPQKGKYKVLRGASWRNDRAIHYCAFRRFDFPDLRLSSMGFRCVMSHPPRSRLDAR